MLHFILELTDSKQRKADFKTRDSPGWMRPGGAYQSLLMHMNCCHSTVLFLGFQPLTCESGLLLLGHHERSGHSIHPWPWSAIVRRGASLFGNLGLLNHQGTSWTQGTPYFPWLPVPWRRSPGGVGSDPEGGKGAQRQGDSNIHKMRVQKEIAQAGSNWCVFCASNMPAFVYFFNLNKSQALNGKSDFCFPPLLVLQLKRSFYMALKIKLQKAQALCPGGRESSHQTGRRKQQRLAHQPFPENEVGTRKYKEMGTSW